MLKSSDKSGSRLSGWQDSGDYDPVAVFKRRGIHIDIYGDEGQGKSSLALTLAAVGQIGYVNIDQSIDRAYVRSKKEWKNVKRIDVQYTAGLTPEETSKICKPIFPHVQAKVAEACASWAKGIIIDTGHELWQILCMGKFGTLTPKGRTDNLYGPLNAQMRSLLRGVNRQAGKHLITVHHTKDEYADKKGPSGVVSTKTGNKIKACWKEINQLADVVLKVERSGDVMMATIELCKLPPHGPSIEGDGVTGDDLDVFSIIAQATGTKREEWLK